MITRVEQRRVVARKKHRCWECGHLIEVGEEHIDDVLKDDAVYHYRAHGDCYACAMAVDEARGFTLSGDERYPLHEDDDFKDELDAWATEYPRVVARFRRPS
ncbi:hypothetical protein Pan1_90 [Pseudanabaena phage Pan1]|nr:hypothetical protein Pan1_90 [Pseudanabaena phage Pan1]